MKKHKRFVGRSVKDVDRQYDEFFGEQSTAMKDILMTKFCWEGDECVFECEYDDTIFHG